MTFIPFTIWKKLDESKARGHSVCTWTLSVVLAAGAQSIAEERPPQTSPDTTVLDNGMKQKLESAKSLGPASTPQQTSPDTSPVDKAIKQKLK